MQYAEALLTESIGSDAFFPAKRSNAKQKSQTHSAKQSPNTTNTEAYTARSKNKKQNDQTYEKCKIEATVLKSMQKYAVLALLCFFLLVSTRPGKQVARKAVSQDFAKSVPNPSPNPSLTFTLR